MILNINHIVYENDDSYYVIGNEKIELTEESEKALIDLIDQRIDKRRKENVYRFGKAKPLKSLSEEVDPAILEPLGRLIEKAEAKLGHPLNPGEKISEILLSSQNQ